MFRFEYFAIGQISEMVIQYVDLGLIDPDESHQVFNPVIGG
jgi:hypothetical protein